MKQSQVQGNWQQIRLLEQKEALSRGEGISGKKGEGFVGTIIKDTWTIMGEWKKEGGGEGWGLG